MKDDVSERAMSNEQAELFGVVCKMHTAWMRREEMMRQQGGFELIARMATLLDEIVDDVPRLWRVVGAALTPTPPKGDLCERLRAIDDAGEFEGCLVNPDGPEAADRIEALERGLSLFPEAYDVLTRQEMRDAKGNWRSLIDQQTNALTQLREHRPRRSAPVSDKGAGGMSRRCLICSNINPCRLHSEDAQDRELTRNMARVRQIEDEQRRSAAALLNKDTPNV
jgi:hypothetical protein